MENKLLNYTTINHIARLELKMSANEYMVADLIYQLSNNPDSDFPGWCYSSKSNLGKYLGLSEKSVHSILNSLFKVRIDNKPILEKNPITKHLKITSAWYNKVIIKKAEESSATLKKGKPMAEESSAHDTEESSDNKDIYNKDNNNNIILHSNGVTGKEINKLITMFKPINPSYEKLFKITTQRKCLENLVKKHGYGKIHRMIEQLPAIVSQPYAPTITTPYQLENKLGELILFVNKYRNNKKGGTIVVR